MKVQGQISHVLNYEFSVAMNPALNTEQNMEEVEEDYYDGDITIN